MSVDLGSLPPRSLRERQLAPPSGRPIEGPAPSDPRSAEGRRRWGWRWPHLVAVVATVILAVVAVSWVRDASAERARSDDLSATAASLSADLSDTEANLAATESRIAELRVELGTAEQLLAATLAELADSETIVSEREAAVRPLIDAVSALDTELVAVGARMNRVTSRLNSVAEHLAVGVGAGNVRDISGLAESVDRATSEIEAADAALVEVGERVEAARRALEHLSHVGSEIEGAEGGAGS